MKLTIDERYTKTYASEARLERALEQSGIDLTFFRYMVVRTPETGRFTALFFMNDRTIHHASYIVSKGFMVIG